MRKTETQTNRRYCPSKEKRHITILQVIETPTTKVQKENMQPEQNQKEV